MSVFEKEQDRRVQEGFICTVLGVFADMRSSASAVVKPPTSCETSDLLLALVSEEQHLISQGVESS